MARERVTFTMNEQIHVVLASPGIEQPNSTGAAEWRYFLEGEKVMWVPQQIHEAIQSASGGDPVGKAFTLQRYKPGAAPFTWQVAGPHQPPASTGNAYRDRPNTGNLPRAGTPIQPGYSATNQPAQTQPARPLGQPQPAAQMQPGEVPLSLGDSLAGAFCASIDVAGSAMVYAKAHGMQISFTAGDIRAMAATLFIRMQEGGAQ